MVFCIAQLTFDGWRPRKAASCGSFQSIPELVAAIEGYLKCHNQNPRVFFWKASADSMMTKLTNCKEALTTPH